MEINKQVQFQETSCGVVKMTTIEGETNDNGMIENLLVILTKQTIDNFLKTDNPSELIALYTFYYYTAKWQETNSIKCTTNYVAKGLKWGEEKVIKYKKQLLNYGLIQDITRRDDQGKIIGHFIKMNYIFKKTTLENIIHTPVLPEGGFSQGVAKTDINALSAVNLNALSNPKSQMPLTKDMFKDIYETYPTVCPYSKRPLYRTKFNLKTMDKLVKDLGKDEIKEIIQIYLKACSFKSTYLKNFETFINNFPSRSDFITQPCIQNVSNQTHNIPKHSVESEI